MPQAVIASSTTDRSAVDAERQFEQYRRELTGYCYRMLGSAFEAEDAVQETMVRAWRAFDRFEGRSSLRSWLYRIATNVCLDMLRGPPAAGPARWTSAGRRRRSASPARRAARGHLGRADPRRRRRCPTAATRPRWRVGRESIRLAFVAALQHLPPRQRAVLILREVLRWQADRGGRAARHHGGLGQQRAAAGPGHAGRARPRRRRRDRRRSTTTQQELLARYVDAFERYDIDALVALLHEDAIDVDAAVRPVAAGPRRDRAVAARTGRRAAAGSRLVPVAANGSPGFGQYRPTARTGRTRRGR